MYQYVGLLKHYTKISVIYFILIILIAHWIAPDSYGWQLHTVSHLGSQGYELNWIMNLGFIGFGFILGFGSLLKSESTLPDQFIAGYAFCIIITGIFKTQPFLEKLPYDSFESSIHSLFATLAGFLFCFGIFLKGRTDKNSAYIHYIFFLVIIGLSSVFGIEGFSYGIGMMQKVMYVISFIWLGFFLPTSRSAAL